VDVNRFKEPAFAVGVVVLVLLVASWLFPKQCADSEAADAVQSLDETNARLGRLENQLARLRAAGSESSLGQGADESQQFRDAVQLAKDQLAAGHFLPSYDLILVASRLNPSDPKLFDLLISFIEKCRDAKDEEAEILADDLINRGEALIHFQLPKDVASARERFTTLSKRAEAPPEGNSAPLTEVLELLAVAEDTALAVPIRTDAAEQARNTLAGIVLSGALSRNEEPPSGDSAESEGLRQRIDAAEQACIAELFRNAKGSAVRWLTSSEKRLKESKSIDADGTPAVVARLSDSISTGFDLVQELAPYGKSGVAGAADFVKQVEKQITLLQRTKSWLYNQQVLRLIRDIESRKDLSTEAKIGFLAEVNEEHLSPYILRRHSELWEKLFEELPDEAKKAEAVRLRILHVKE